MTADEFYSRAESEGGRVINDPSEDAIYLLIGQLDDSENSFLTIEPTDKSLGWFVSIARREEGDFEVELRDATTNEHDVIVQTDPSRIAREATLWMSGRPKSPRRHLLNE